MDEVVRQNRYNPDKNVEIYFVERVAKIHNVLLREIVASKLLFWKTLNRKKL